MKTINEAIAVVEALDQRVHALAKEVHAGNTELRKRTNVLRFVLMATVIVVVVAIMSAAQVLLDNRAQLEENNRKFCPIVAAQLPRPGVPEPTSARGRYIVKQFQYLAKEFHCTVDDARGPDISTGTTNRVVKP